MTPFSSSDRKKEYAPSPWHLPSLALSPDPEVTEQKSYGVYQSLGKAREKGIHHRPRRKVYTVEASDPKRKKKRGFPQWWCILFFFSVRVGESILADHLNLVKPLRAVFSFLRINFL